MKSLRFLLITIFSWLFLVYNIERLTDPINIASFVYILNMSLLIMIIAIPWLRSIPLIWALILPMPIFFFIKVGLGYQVGGQKLPLTITEIFILSLTIVLARLLGERLDEISNSITQVVLSHLRDLSRPFAVGQDAMYREVRWARTHQRPLALLAISFTEEAFEQSANRFLKEIQRETVKKYVQTRLADLLSKELRSADILTQRNDHFLALLPEVGADNVAEFMTKLERSARADLGFSLKIGASTFPEEITFEKLVERAEANISRIETMQSGDPTVEITSGRDLEHSHEVLA